MSDLVDRLRAAEPCGEDKCRVMDARSGCVCAEAANEIERLRDCRRILERIAGGDGYYPELARTCLHMTEH